VLLGFANYTQPDEPGVVSFEGSRVFLETEGSTEAVAMAPHYRLRARIEQSIAAEGGRPLGLIVINGFRDQPPEARPQQFEDSLRVAAESMRYCVIESTKLFEAANLALRGETDAVKAFRQRLLATEGVFSSE